MGDGHWVEARVLEESTGCKKNGVTSHFNEEPRWLVDKVVIQSMTRFVYRGETPNDSGLGHSISCTRHIRSHTFGCVV